MYYPGEPGSSRCGRGVVLSGRSLFDRARGDTRLIRDIAWGVLSPSRLFHRGSGSFQATAVLDTHSRGLRRQNPIPWVLKDELNKGTS